MEPVSVTISYRPALDSDRHFIVSAWSQSYRTAYTAGMISDGNWYDVMDREVGIALDRPDVRTLVASTADGLLGFITADTDERPPLVYYVYCKAPYRRMGIARQLFSAIGIDPALPFFYVCSTPMVRTLARKIPLSRWQPLYGRFPKSERKQGRQAR
jgi:GNAT superfamily N-acetyltransferase